MTDDELLVRVREDIANAKENGFDFFGDPAQADMSDMDIAGDMGDCTDSYADVPDDQMVAAIAKVRAEHRDAAL